VSHVFKIVKPTDFIVTPYTAKKSISFSSASAGIVNLSGSVYQAAVYLATYQSNSIYTLNESEGTSSSYPKTINDKYQGAMHDSINTLFYDNYDIKNLSKHGEFFNNQRRQLSKQATVISIPSKKFGDKIYPGTFSMTGSISGSEYYIKDDSLGNIYDMNVSSSLSESIDDDLYLVGEWRLIDNYRVYDDVSNKNKLKSVHDYSRFENQGVITGSVRIDTSETYTPVCFFTSSKWQSIRIPHKDRLNFRKDEDFSISVRIQPNTEQTYTSSHDSNVILTKSGKIKKFVVGDFKNPHPGNKEIGGTITGDFVDKTFEGPHPYEISYINVGSDKGKVKMTRYDGNITSSLTSDTICTGSTFHVIFQKTGSMLECFIDGVKNSSGSDTVNGSTLNVSDVFIGSRGDGEMRYDGEIGLYSTRIYNKALNENQALNLYLHPYNSPNVGNIFYSYGLVTMTNPVHSGSYKISSGDFPYLDMHKRIHPLSSSFINSWGVEYSSSLQMYQNEVHCTVPPGDYNMTMNPTVRKKTKGLSIESTQEVANFVTHSSWNPYATTVGLYNSLGELLVVGSLARPIQMTNYSDITFVLRFDTDRIIGNRGMGSGMTMSMPA
tara:strand:- start:1391 stop:3211 length:1821 start_codon:yes stop_codon:yes gene_type:complete